MTRDDQAAVAQVAYQAYGETTHFRNFRDEPMPQWEDLGERIQHAWMNAASAAAAAALNLTAHLIDRGPTFPVPPSVISALVRERADDLI